MEWLNFHHLRYFWTVARKGSVRKAADELHVSQPSISAQILLLEEWPEAISARRTESGSQ
jgi:LysR family transcriptional regulator, transcriptional activator of nhaA